MGKIEVGEVVSSLQNGCVKLASSLKQKKYRDKEGLFLAEGVRIIEDIVSVGGKIRIVLYDVEAVSERIEALLSSLDASVRQIAVTPAVYRKIQATEESQGIVAIVEQKQWMLADIAGGCVHLAVLDRVQDPGNIGTIIRTAEAAGWDGVLVLRGSADIYSPKVVRSTMGTMLHLPVVRGLSEDELGGFLAEHTIRLYATSVVESKTYDACDFTQSAAVVFGNEGAGVSESLLANADERIHIPLYGRVESLNVAAAAAVICFEGARQRQTACQAR